MGELAARTRSRIPHYRQLRSTRFDEYWGRLSQPFISSVVYHCFFHISSGLSLSVQFMHHSRLLVRHNNNALSEVSAFQDVNEPLPCILEPADDVLLVLDLPARDACRERPVEFFLILGDEGSDKEAMECDLPPYELLEVLHVVRILGVVAGDVAADLYWPRRGEGCSDRG